MRSLQSYKKIEKHDNSGVYQIINKVNRKKYIGSSMKMWTRFRSHINCLRIKDHDNVYLQKDYEKHGQSVFSFKVLEYCINEKLFEREQYWIDYLKPKYNIWVKSDSPAGVKRREETKEKMRCPKSAEHRRNLSISRMGMPSPRKGVILSDVTKEKMRLANIGKKYSNEVNMKKGRAGDLHPSWGTGKSVVQFTVQDILIGGFISAGVAAKSIGKNFGGSNIIKCCDKKIPTAYGYKWSYKN